METNRVLSRVGARILSEEEVQQVAGGLVVRRLLTGPCVFDPITCQIVSGDCKNIPPACGS